MIYNWKSILQAFAKEGAKVIATDIQKDKLKELEQFGKCLYINTIGTG